MSKIHFTGLVHNEAKDNSYNGFYLNENEMKEKVKELVGKKLTDRHLPDSRLPDVIIGQITAAEMTPEKKLRVKGYLTRDTPNGCKVINRIRDGTTTGLSLGIKHQVNGDFEVVGKQIEHVSVAKNPDCFTYIDYIEPDSEKFIEGRQLISAFDQLNKLKKEVYKRERERPVNRGLPGSDIQTDMAEQERGTKRPAGEAEEETQRNSKKQDTKDNKALSDAEELEQLREAKRQLQRQVEETQAKLQSYESVGKTPEEIQEEEARKEAKRLKNIEENQKASLDFATELGVIKEDNIIMRALRDAKTKPKFGSEVVDFVTVARRHIIDSISKKEKELQEAREANKKYQEVIAALEKEQRESSKKTEYYKYVRPEKANNAPADKEEREYVPPPVKREPLKDSVAYKTERPDISGIAYDGTRLNGLRAPRLGKSFKDLPTNRTVWDEFAYMPKTFGQEKIDYVQRDPSRIYRPTNASQMSSIKGGVFYELDF